jgi:hypothetical protein
MVPVQPTVWTTTAEAAGQAGATISATFSGAVVSAGDTAPTFTRPARTTETVPWWRRRRVHYNAEATRLVPGFLNLDDPLNEDAIDHHYEYDVCPNGQPRQRPSPYRRWTG